MSSKPCPKRRRCASPSAALRSSILSTFRVSDSSEDFFGLARSSMSFPAEVGRTASPPLRIRSHADIVLGDLACIFTESGALSYRAIVAGLRNRTLSTSAVVNALVDGDDADEVAPLCWIVTLLEQAVLRTADFHPPQLARRCRLEVGSPAMTCRCPPPGPFGLKGLIEVVLGDGISNTRDAVLEALIEPLIVGGEQHRLGAAYEPAFRLAARTLETLKLYSRDIEDYQRLIYGWIMQSLKVTGDGAAAQRDARASSDVETSMWTQELISIATAALDNQNLGLKRYEADSVQVLLSCISPADAAKLAVSSITLLFSGDRFSTQDSYIGPILNWRRAMYLVRRLCDSRRWSDVNGSERSSVEACLTTALASPLAASSPKRMAVVLTIARFMYRCCRNADNDEDVERGFREYDRWLGRIAQSIPKGSVKTLCVCLSELIPVEPVRYLRSSLKIFSGVNAVSDVVRDYTTVANIRLRELSANSGKTGLPTSIQTPVARAHAAAKAVEDVCKFVAEFARNNGKVPPALVRLMNFHRYYFRSQLLEHLLSKDLSPSAHFLQREFPRGGLGDFNKQRIAMLTVMAFDRKDRVVTEAEARSAIQSIRTGVSTGQVGDSAPIQENPSSIENLTESSPAGNMISSIATIVTKLENAGLGTCRDDFQEECDRMCRLLATKLALLCRDDAAGIIDVASSFLCSVLDCVGHHNPSLSLSEGRAEPCAVQFSIRDIWNRRTSDAKFQEWARITCAWLHVLLCNVVADCRLARFRRALQGRLLIAICLQFDQLSELQALSGAVLIYAMSGLSNDEALHDLTIVMVEHGVPRAQEISDTIAENLCVDSSNQIRRSSQYAIFYAHLVMSQPLPVTFERSGKDRFVNVNVESLLSYGVGDGDKGSTARARSAGRSVCASPSNHRVNSSQESGAQRNYLPSSLIWLLRWVSTCPWRFLVEDARRTAMIDTRKAEWQARGQSRRLSSPELDPASGIVLAKQIIELLQSPCCSNMKLDVGRWTWYEIRAGAGRVQEAVDILLRFVASACKCHVIAAVARTIVKSVLQAKCERGAVEVCGSWLQFACLVVARDQVVEVNCPSCGEDWTTSTAKLEQLEYPFMEAFELCSTEESNSSLAACSVYMDFIRILPPELYLGCAPCQEVHRHFSQFVIPIFWPLSESTTKTFASAYIAWELRQFHQETRGEPPLALSIACAMHWNSLERTTVFKQALSDRRLTNLLERAKALIPVVTFPLSCDNVGRPSDVVGVDGGSSHSQLPPDAAGSASQKGLDFVLCRYPAEAGVALAASAMQVAHSTSIHNLRPSHASARPFLTCLTSFGDRRTLEVLDVMIEVLARFPMAKAFRLDDTESTRADDLSMNLLTDVVRLRLSAGHLCPTFLETMVDTRDVSSRSAVSFVREELAFSSEPVTSLRSERDADAKGRDTKPSSLALENQKLIHTYSNARVIIALSRLDHQSFRTIKNATGQRELHECIGRALHVYLHLRRTVDRTSSRLLGEADCVLKALLLLEHRISAAVVHIVNENADFILHPSLSREIKVLNPALWAQLKRDQPEFVD